MRFLAFVETKAFYHLEDTLFSANKNDEAIIKHKEGIETCHQLQPAPIQTARGFLSQFMNLEALLSLDPKPGIS